MSEIVTTARTARELLAKGLGGLQANPNVSPQYLEAAEPIAAAMGALHRIERSAGAEVVAAAPQALDAIRKALGILQTHATTDAYMVSVMETVASSLGHAFALTKMQAPAAQPAPAPVAQAAPAMGAAAASTQPVPQMPAAQPVQPAPYAPPPQAAQPAANWQPPPQAAQPSWQQQPAPQPQPAQPPWQQQPAPQAQPAQPSWQQQPAPQAQPAQPLWQQQPAPQPQPAQPPWQQQQPAPYAPPAPAAQAQQYAPPPQASPQAAPYAPPPQPQGWQQPAPQAAPYGAPQPAAHQAPPGAAPSPYAVAPNYPVVEAELGTHSPTNFYKGLAGNDVVDHGGIFIATYKIPSVGETFRVHVSLPGGYEFEAVGVVRWTRESRDSMTTDISPPGFGMQFTQITPEARQLVYRYARNREPLFHDDL